MYSSKARLLQLGARGDSLGAEIFHYERNQQSYISNEGTEKKTKPANEYFAHL